MSCRISYTAYELIQNRYASTSATIRGNVHLIEQCQREFKEAVVRALGRVSIVDKTSSEVPERWHLEKYQNLQI